MVDATNGADSVPMAHPETTSNEERAGEQNLPNTPDSTSSEQVSVHSASSHAQSAPSPAPPSVTDSQVLDRHAGEKKLDDRAQPEVFRRLRALGVKLRDHYEDGWLWEILNVSVAICCMVALVGLLLYYNHRPTRTWHLGITLNGMIAVLSTIWQSTMLLAVSE